MQVEKRFTISDILVTIICLIGFYYSLQLFNNELNQSLEKINEQPIGTITFKYKSAQRKLIDRLLWDRIKQNSPVYNGDIIRTAELSEATVSFADGNVIDLYEQTLAQVFLDLEDGAAIDFSGGGVSLTTSSTSNGMTLSSGNANIQVSAGAVLNATAPLFEGEMGSNQLSLQMTYGQASLLDGENDEEVLLTEGRALIFDEQTNTFLPPGITVMTPSPNARYLTQSNNAEVPFSWQKENIASNEFIILETSQNKNFETVYEQISFTNVSSITLSMPEGIWYWRIYTQSQSSVASGKVQVLSSPEPTTVVPAQGTEFGYRSKEPQVRFMWNNDDYARSWVFEISENEQMLNPIISQQTSQPSTIVNTLEEGRYYWTITPTYTSSFLGQDTFISKKSQVKYFDIIKQGDLTKAELVLPINGGFVDAANNQDGYYFTWKHDYEASEYRILISADETLSNPVVEQSIKENFFILHSDIAQITEGTWYWAVTKVDTDENISPQSDIFSFYSVQGRVEQRTLFPPNNYTVAENLILDTVFTWKTNLPFAMKFQIASDESFNTIIIEETLSSSSISGLAVPIGTWFWRIVADSNSTGIPYETDAKIFSVSPYLEKVFVGNITQNTTVVVRPSVPIEFTWDAVKDADYYQVRLYDTDDRKTPVYENLVVQDTKIAIDMEDFDEGEYSLALRAMAAETNQSTRQTGLLSEQEFNMEKLVPISLLTPTDGYEYDGVAIIENLPVLEWSSVEVPFSSRLVVTNSNYGLSLSHRLIGRTIREQNVAFSINNPKTKEQIPLLPAGTWYWTVLAETEEGFDISPQQAGYFVIGNIEPYGVPNIVSPQDNLNVTIDYLRQQTYIDFAWDTVTDGFYVANAYIFTLLDENNNVIHAETITNATSKRLEILNPPLFSMGSGTYSWTIEAVYRNEQGAVIISGKKEELDIIVDVGDTSTKTRSTQRDLFGR